jgi:hypothetical protein
MLERKSKAGKPKMDTTKETNGKAVIISDGAADEFRRPESLGLQS